MGVAAGDLRLTPLHTGMTSPPRLQATSSPISIPSCSINDQLLRLQRVTTAPPKLMGSRTATGVRFPVRPVCHTTSRKTVPFCSEGNLKLHPQLITFDPTPASRLA